MVSCWDTAVLPYALLGCLLLTGEARKRPSRSSAGLGNRGMMFRWSRAVTREASSSGSRGHLLQWWDTLFSFNLPEWAPLKWLTWAGGHHRPDSP